MDHFLLSLRVAVRDLFRNPGFALVATGTLALGIGANVAVFSVVNAALLRPLPWSEPDRLVAIASTRDTREISVSWPDFRDWESTARSFDGLAAYLNISMNLTGDGEAERVRATVISPEAFALLGVAPASGRGFTAAENEPGAAPVAVLGHGLWQRRFGGDPGIVGSTILLNDAAWTVVGIMPQGFDFPSGIVYGPGELWLPTGQFSAQWDDRQEHPGIVVIGRLAEGVSLPGARSELQSIAARLEQEYPATNEGEGIVMRTALEAVVGDTRTTLFLVLGAVGLVLLIACANVANLLLARATSRRREIAVRTALGAGPRAIAAQLAAESLVLACTGGALGLLLAFASRGLFRPLLAGMPRMNDIPMDGRVVAFAALSVLLTALVFGLAPLRSAVRLDIDRWLRERSGSGDRQGHRTRSTLAVLEVAIALVLLVSASVLLRSFAALRAESGGIDPHGVLTFELRVPESRYDAAGSREFHARLTEQLRALPGAVEVGAISVLPFSGAGAQSGLTAPGYFDEGRSTDVAIVTPGYFAAMGMRLLRGRLLDERDDAQAPVVAVVDEVLAEQFWPGEDPLGKTIGGWGFHTITVVGVVNHVKNYGVAANSRQELWVSHAQRPLQRMIYAVRTSSDPVSIAGPVRSLVSAMDASVPVYNVRTMEDVVNGTVAAPRLAATLSASFGILAAGLALVGIYGVIAFAVVQRTREMGVRMAMGATPASIRLLVVSDTLKLAGMGVAGGLLGALVATRALQSMVFGVSALDPLSLALATGSLLVVALLAGYVPAARAARVAPSVVLSDE